MPKTMTLVEYAKGLPQDSLAKPIIEIFAQSSDIAGALPVVGFTGAAYQTYRQGALPPSITFRAINEAPGSGQGRLDPYSEPSFPIDWHIDVDRAIIDRHGPDRRGWEERLATARLGRSWAATIMSGDNTTQPREPNGLKKRASLYGAAGGANARVINNSASSGGAALSLANLDILLNSVNGATHLIAPRKMIPRWIAAARDTDLTGFVMQTWDGIGMPKMSYAGRPILFGYEREMEPELLDFNEVAAGGGSAVTTSIYAVKFAEDGFHAVELKPMSIVDKGLLEDGVTYRTHLSWDIGLADEHPFCIGRLTSITDAAIAA